MSKNARYAWRLSLGGLLLGLLACAVYLLAVPLGFKYGEIQVGHGLEHEGRIAWDAAGVPHIRAQSLKDGYFLLGYSHARDRLWQMEFARRYAGGTLSEVFGAKTLPMDRFARTLGFRRTAEGIYANLDAPTRVLLQRYSDGINAYLELAPAALPLEFSLVRHERPGPWGPVDSLSLHLLYSWTLSANLGMQLQRLALAEHLTWRGSTRCSPLSGRAAAGHPRLRQPVPLPARHAGRRQAAGATARFQRRRHRFEQLGGLRQPQRHRQAAAGQRSTPAPDQPGGLLPGQPEDPRPEPHRRQLRRRPAVRHRP